MYKRVVVAVDPAVSSGDNSDETGIVVVAKDEGGKAYVLDDLSGKYPPLEWARVAVNAYHKYGADRLIAEKNQGGDLVHQMIKLQDKSVAYKAVHASKGKRARAEPVAALYEQGRVFHTRCFGKLENQMCTFTVDSKTSPDRLDALVWALTELMLHSRVGDFSVWS